MFEVNCLECFAELSLKNLKNSPNAAPFLHYIKVDTNIFVPKIQWHGIQYKEPMEIVF
jgi:hypothetical protein